MRFISERALSLHKEYVENERLRLSVFKKTYPELTGNSVRDILRSRCKEKREVARLKLNVACHKLYFSSFGRQYSASEAVRRSYGSEATFLYELGRTSDGCGEKFVFVYSDGCEVNILSGNEWELARIKGNILVLDLCEHAYFLDYGFDRSAYVKKMLPYLDLSKLDKKISPKD